MLFQIFEKKINLETRNNESESEFRIIRIRVATVTQVPQVPGTGTQIG